MPPDMQEPERMSINHANQDSDNGPSSEEATAMCQISSGAMEKKPEMIGALVDILSNTEREYADVTCAENDWPREIGVLIKDYLLRDKFADRWLYCGKDMDQNRRLRQAIEDLGRSPYEVSKKCWSILEKHNLVRTAEEEALWRFRHAEQVPGPLTRFGHSLSFLLRSFLRACPQTVEMEIKFVQAGQLHLNIALSEDMRLVRINERWLSMKDVIAELGLSGKMAIGGLANLAAKNLFADILLQMPQEAFKREGNDMSAEWHIRREMNRADERLVNYRDLHVRRIISKSDNGSPGLCVEWNANSRQQEDITMIEVQCHRASRCHGLRHEMLIAKDAMRLKMDCFPIEIGPGSDLQVSNPQSPTCRVCHVPFKQGAHYESGLEEGEEYFFVLLTPMKPNSFVSMSQGVCLVAQPRVPPNPAASASAGPTDPIGASRRLADDLDMGEGMSIVVKGSGSPEPMNGLNSLDFAHNGAAGPSAASGSSNQRLLRNTTNSRAFWLDEPLTSLDLWKVDTNRLYKAGNSKNVDAFIGIMKGEPRHPEEPRHPQESRKRRRLD